MRFSASNSLFTRELNSVAELMKRVCQLVATSFTEKKEIFTKEGGELVTDVDLIANHLIVDSLHKLFPNDETLSEESGYSSLHTKAKRIWVVDPIDGTREFAAGNPLFTVLIALLVEGHPRLGFIGHPIGGDILLGEVGRGAQFWDTQVDHVYPCFVSANEDVPLLWPSSPNPPLDMWMNSRPGRIRSGRESDVMSTGFHTSEVTDSRSDFYFYTGPYHIWDVCAPEAVLRAAGGNFTDLAGRDIDYSNSNLRQGGFLASNGLCHDGVLKMLRPFV